MESGEWGGVGWGKVDRVGGVGRGGGPWAGSGAEILEILSSELRNLENSRCG